MTDTNLSNHQAQYFWLTAITLFTFGFIGSLGHGFAVLFVFAFLVFDGKKIWASRINYRVLTVYLALSGVWYVLVLRSLPITPWSDLVAAAAPMFPIAFVGLLILLSAQASFKIAPKALGNIACASVIGIYLVILILDLLPSGHALKSYHQPRLSLFSGNAIPFSTVSLSLSVMCLLGWHSRTRTLRVFALGCALAGAYAAIILSGSRGPAIALVLISPLIAWHLTRSKIWASALCGAFIVSACAVLMLQHLDIININFLHRITSGIETLITGENVNNSNYYRMHMWIASLSAIGDAPLFGFGLTERFEAIRPHLIEGVDGAYSHPHNDVFASAVSGGVFAGVAAALALLSPIVAWRLINRDNQDAFFLATVVAIIIFVAGSVNTIFFNDVASSWLAVSTFLVCCMGTPKPVVSPLG